MFKDIIVYLRKGKIDFNYKQVNGEIICTIKNFDMIENQELDIVYDENIYKIKVNESDVVNTSTGKITIIPKTSLNFTIILNYKYFVKTVFKYINNYIDNDTLVEEIKIFKNSKAGQKYSKELNELLDKIDNENEYQKIEQLLLNNEIYISFAKEMTDQDLMLLITHYITSKKLPMINQETFNNLVKSAINYDNAKENVWRLGMNYDNTNRNYDLLDEFFVNSKDVYYLSEYMYGVDQVNVEKIVNLLINTNDKEYIKEFLNDFFVDNNLDEKYKNLLNEIINDK